MILFSKFEYPSKLNIVIILEFFKQYFLIFMILNRNWFTMIEMMVVVVIMGLFFVVISQFTQNSNIQQTNVDRLANHIYDSIRGARNNMLIGRGIFSWSTLIATDRRIISISNAKIDTIYESSSHTGIENSLLWPFYDNDANFRISDISVSSNPMLNDQTITWDYTGVTSAQIIVSPTADMTITAIKGWSGITTPVNTMRITAHYNGFEKSVMLNAPMGKVELVRWIWEMDYTMLPPPSVNSCSLSSPACLVSWWCNVVTLSPSSVNQWWVLDAPSCWFSCNPWYSGINCEIPPAYTCSITFPSCSTNSPATCSLTYLPVSIDQPWLKWAATCWFACTGWYTWPDCTTPPPVIGFETTWHIWAPGYGDGSNILKFNIIANAWARIDWGDATPIEMLPLTWVVAHTYGVSGDYTVKMSGITAFYRTDDWGWDNQYHGKLLSVDDWGGIAWTSMNGMFAYADHITSLPIGLPNTTSVTDMVSLFSNALLFDQDISSWCVISIGTKPADFDTNTPTPTFRNNVWKQPQWGAGC